MENIRRCCSLKNQLRYFSAVDNPHQMQNTSVSAPESEAQQRTENQRQFFVTGLNLEFPRSSQH